MPKAILFIFVICLIGGVAALNLTGLRWLSALTAGAVGGGGTYVACKLDKRQA